jgi:hypothetical protein
MAGLTVDNARAGGGATWRLRLASAEVRKTTGRPLAVLPISWRQIELSGVMLVVGWIYAGARASRRGVAAARAEYAAFCNLSFHNKLTPHIAG